MLSYLLQLKIIWISFSISFFSQFLQNFKSSWRVYHLVVFIAKLWDDNLVSFMAFLLLKLCKFSYISFLKSSFVYEKSCSFQEGLDATVLSSFFENIMLVFIFLLIYFTIQHLEYIQDEVRHTKRVLQVSHFLSPSLIIWIITGQTFLWKALLILRREPYKLKNSFSLLRSAATLLTFPINAVKPVYSGYLQFLKKLSAM